MHTSPSAIHTPAPPVNAAFAAVGRRVQAAEKIKKAESGGAAPPSSAASGDEKGDTESDGSAAPAEAPPSAEDLTRAFEAVLTAGDAVVAAVDSDELAR